MNNWIDNLTFLEKNKILGEGAFSEVIKVKDNNDNKIYALKKVIQQDEFEKYFKRRYDKSNSRNLTSLIIKTSQYNKILQELLKYAGNGCLFFYIHSQQGLPEELALRFFYQSALAVKNLHDQNLIHRDIKPENILLDDDFNVKLCDFGWSCFLEQDDFRTSVCGTYEYMSPEIVHSKNHTNKVDIWCLGVLLYEMLHGSPPFKADNFSQIREEFLNKNILIKKSISRDTKNLLKNILRIDDNKRYNIDQVLNHPALNQKIDMFYQPLSEIQLSILLRNYLLNTDTRGKRIMPEALTFLMDKKQKLINTMLNLKDIIEENQYKPVQLNFKRDSFYNFETKKETSKNQIDKKSIAVKPIQKNFKKKQKAQNLIVQSNNKNDKKNAQFKSDFKKTKTAQKNYLKSCESDIQTKSQETNIFHDKMQCDQQQSKIGFQQRYNSHIQSQARQNEENDTNMNEEITQNKIENNDMLKKDIQFQTQNMYLEKDMKNQLIQNTENLFLKEQQELSGHGQFSKNQLKTNKNEKNLIDDQYFYLQSQQQLNYLDNPKLTKQNQKLEKNLVTQNNSSKDYQNLGQNQYYSINRLSNNEFTKNGEKNYELQQTKKKQKASIEKEKKINQNQDVKENNLINKRQRTRTPNKITRIRIESRNYDLSANPFKQNHQESIINTQSVQQLQNDQQNQSNKDLLFEKENQQQSKDILNTEFSNLKNNRNSIQQQFKDKMNLDSPQEHESNQQNLFYDEYQYQDIKNLQQLSNQNNQKQVQYMQSQKNESILTKIQHQRSLTSQLNINQSNILPDIRKCFIQPNFVSSRQIGVESNQKEDFWRRNRSTSKVTIRRINLNGDIKSIIKKMYQNDNTENIEKKETFEEQETELQQKLKKQSLNKIADNPPPRLRQNYSP